MARGHLDFLYDSVFSARTPYGTGRYYLFSLWYSVYAVSAVSIMFRKKSRHPIQYCTICAVVIILVSNNDATRVVIIGGYLVEFLGG